ncbi:SDR family NAD(P)-dependent oxidoreductase [Amycolatopsis endophytica]|uniref:Probable oxidoreductase n=2 Tax=Amycolatopsis endophytica TaxID=860233 RepID=A0A853B2K8_9PSEU|nr:NAD(P)-dependent dehydrogenase (short-subunit alcohol dehydrogenase family) [Amycolatopsis endophytica]
MTGQRRIGSGFDAGSTASDVLAGVDLRGKLALVTGGYSGLGLETTKALSAVGAHVVVPARRPEVAAKALPGVEVGRLDLADQDSVRTFAEDFLASGRGIDLLIGNAGIMACPETRVGPGWEAQFAINHLGHHALVNLLWPAVRPGARVVMVSSRGHHFSGIRWDDVHFEHGYDKWLAYGQAKTANVLFAVHLDTLARDRGVRAFAVHPGRIRTELGRHLTREDFAGFDGDDAGYRSPEQGAATQVWAATSPRLDGMGGLYCEDCDIAEPAPAEGEWTGVREHAIDPEQAARLWTLSAELTGLDRLSRP